MFNTARGESLNIYIPHSHHSSTKKNDLKIYQIFIIMVINK